MKETFLMTRKINGKEYKFYHLDYTKEESWVGTQFGNFMVETPENAFGFPDYVFFEDGTGSTQHRYLAPYIIKKLRGYLERKGFDPDSRAYMEF